MDLRYNSAGPARGALRSSLAGQYPIVEEGEENQAEYEQYPGPDGRAGEPGEGARQLALAVEDKLKLAPILAKRLERVSHSSGSFSSRQTVSIVNPGNPSGRVTPQRRTSGSQYHDYGKLNYLVTSLEGRGERNLKVEGSARLPQVTTREPNGSPTTTSKGQTSHNFDEAKRQVDRDLRLFLEDVRELYNQISQREGADVPIVLEVIASIMDIAEECLETPIEDFRLTITDIVDNIEEERSACQQRTIRALYTRMLFILTRCSRLLITEQQHLFATEPRNRRRHSQVFGPGFTTKTQKELGLHLPPQGSVPPETTLAAPKDEEEPVFRSHTMPVKAMYSMVAALQKDRPGALPPGLVKAAAAWAEAPELGGQSASQVSDSPAGPSTGPASSDFQVLRHQSQSSDLEAYGMPSDSSMTGGTGTGKKKKGFFGSIKKGLKNFMTDGFKRKSSGSKEGSMPDGLQRPLSEMSGMGSHVRFKMSLTEQGPKPPTSPGGLSSRRGTNSGIPTLGDGSSSPSGSASRRLDPQRSVRFQETPVQIMGEGDGSGRRMPSNTGLRTSTSLTASGPPALSKLGSATLGASGPSTAPAASGAGSSGAEAGPSGLAGPGGLKVDTGGAGASEGGPLMSPEGGLDTGKRPKIMVQTDLPMGPMSGPAAPGMGVGPAQRISVEGGRSSASPGVSAELVLAGQRRSGGMYRRASVDLYAAGMLQGLEPMSPDGAAPPEDLEVICSICEEGWLSTHLEEHSIHCAVLRTLSGNGLSVDAQLTTIANVLEEWLETPLAFPALGPAPSQYHVKNQLIKLIRAARNAAALQPDGSKVPTTRCFSIEEEVHELLQHAADSGKLAVVTQTYAHRIIRLVMEKVTLLSEPFGGPARTRGVGSDAGDSGTSTPRSMPGMSIEEFEIIKPISRGAFGRVYLARKLATGDLFAIKVMKKRDLIRKNMVESVTNERNILAMAQNPFVVRFYYSFTSRENLYIVMEYINGGDCYSLLRKFDALDEEVARQYIAETVLALEYCHAQGIIHRDLKPDNLLINAQGHVKLTDFGLSCLGVIDRTDNLNGPQPMDTDGPGDETESGWGGVAADPSGEYSGSAGVADPMDASQGPTSAASIEGSAEPRSSGRDSRVSASGQVLGASPAASTLGLPPKPAGPHTHQRIVAPEHEAKRAVGTPDYLAPELLLGTGHGPEVDWWALGAILYEFITGTPPFNADSPEEIFDNILDRRITWPDEDDMSSDCRDLVDKLLHPNPLKRLGHRGAGEVKLHPWFEGLDWTSLVRNKAAFIPAVEDECDTSYFESKHVSQRSMAEDLEKLRTSTTGEGRGERIGPSSGPAASMVRDGPGTGGRTAVDRLKDQYAREGSGLRSGGSSNSHVSHMSRTSYTGQGGAGNVCSGPQLGQAGPSGSESLDGSRVCSSPGHPFGGGGLEQVARPVYGGSQSGSLIHQRNSVGSSCGAGPHSHSGLRGASGSGARNSGSGVRCSGSGARPSGSGSAGMGGGCGTSDRQSPASASASGGTTGARSLAGMMQGAPGDDTAPVISLEGGFDDGTYDDAHPDDYDERLPEGEEGVEEGEHEEGEHDEGELTPSDERSGGEEEGEDSLALANDPFNNFSFTNYTGLSAANMEKILKLREHFNRRTSYSGPSA